MFWPCTYQCAKIVIFYLGCEEPYSSSRFEDRTCFTQICLHSCGGNDDVVGVDSAVEALLYHPVTSLLLHDPFDCLKIVVVLTIFQKSLDLTLVLKTRVVPATVQQVFWFHSLLVKF